MAQRVEVVLSEEEREVLERWARRPKSSQALALRCRIVLAAAGGERSKDIAARSGCSSQTVGRWRERFAKRGIDGLHDEPRPGKPRQIGDEEVERVIVKTLEEQPPNATHWSTRSMAAATGMSQTAIHHDKANKALLGLGWRLHPAPPLVSRGQREPDGGGQQRTGQEPLQAPTVMIRVDSEDELDPVLR
jgi:transposase